jgi:hypothetical protein
MCAVIPTAEPANRPPDRATAPPAGRLRQGVRPPACGFVDGAKKRRPQSHRFNKSKTSLHKKLIYVPITHSEFKRGNLFN